MSEIDNDYNSLLIENKAGSAVPISTTPSLEGKLIQHLKYVIVIHKVKTRKGNLLFSQKITLEEALKKEKSLASKFQSKLKDVAFTLRNLIKDADHTPLPTSGLKLEHIIAGEVKVPEEVLQFFKYLIQGPVGRNDDSLSKQRRVESINDDVIFTVTSGRKRSTAYQITGPEQKRPTNW